MGMIYDHSMINIMYQFFSDWQTSINGLPSWGLFFFFKLSELGSYEN